MDVDGDGVSDLDPSRIYVTGLSQGGILTVTLLAVDPSVGAGVANVAGSSAAPPVEPANRGDIGRLLAARIPSLINVGGPSGLEVDENFPLRNEPPRINTVPGAVAIQEFLERREWAGLPGSPTAYARHLRLSPLAGVPTKPVIVQFAKGDRTVSNPKTTALIRAGDLADVTTYYRYDLVFPLDPRLPEDPHIMLFPNVPQLHFENALRAQQQIAEFFASDGTTIIDPDEALPVFEVPIVLPLPEELNFLSR